MAYYPKNKAKLKSSKPGQFIYSDNGKPFNGSYIKTSKGQYFEGNDINLPGRTIIPTEKNFRKLQLLALLANLIKLAASIVLLLQVLKELKTLSTDPAELVEIQNLINELTILTNVESLDESVDTSNLNNFISKYPDTQFPQSKNLVVHNGVYNDIKTNIYNKLNNNFSPILVKIPPTDQDYINGQYKRYFAKRTNSSSYYIEIDKKTYESLRDKKKIFDHTLYEVSSLFWNLTPNARVANNRTLNIFSKKFPNLKVLFNDPVQYAPVGKSNLYTQGEELFYANGNSYIGYYHIHPIKGPMVGAVHSSEPHEILYYSHEMSQPEEDIIVDIDTNSNPIVGKLITINKNSFKYVFYVRENPFGIFLEIMDETEASDGNISTIYSSPIFNPHKMTKEELIDLGRRELGLTNQPEYLVGVAVEEDQTVLVEPQPLDASPEISDNPIDSVTDSPHYNPNLGGPQYGPGAR